MRARSAILLALGIGTIACTTDYSWPVPPHRAFPQVGTRDGALLSPMQLVTITAEGDDAPPSFFFEFSRQIGKSEWWRRIAPEYGLTTLTNVAEIVGPAVDGDVTDHDVFTYITDAVAMNGGPERDGNTLYLLYLPEGVTMISEGKANTNCRNFAAYHARYGTRGDDLAVVQRCRNDPNRSTVAASHEVIEAATDPDYAGYVLPAVARKPWTEDVWNAYELTGRAELGDLCEGTFYFERQFFYQRVWSNAAAAAGGDPCIPELGEPFYDTTFDRDWYSVNAGATVSIPFTGWATGPLADWGLRVRVKSSTSGFDATSSLTTFNSGRRGTLTVRAPVGAFSDSFAVVEIDSTRPALGTPMTDGAHVNIVGVHVP